MRSLTGVIHDLKVLQKQDCIDTLEIHAYINEAYVTKDIPEFLLEAYGLFMGAKDIANEIVKAYEENKRSDHFFLIGKQLENKGIMNVFFKILNVFVNYVKSDDAVSGEYQVINNGIYKLGKSLIYDEKENVMNNIYITFNISFIFYFFFYIIFYMS